MAQGLRVDIVSPERLVLSETVQSVTVPGQEGYLTVMAEHEAMMSTLKPGFVTVTGEDGVPRSFYVRGGFADIGPNGLSVLAEEAKTGADFQIAEVQEAILAAEEELKQADTPEARNLAQETLDGWRNLTIEAQHIGPTVQL